jgi:hypothetical protein
MKRMRSLAAAAALLFVATATHAQVTATTSVALNVTQASVISISASTPTVTIPSVAAGMVTSFPTFNVTTAWNQPASAGTNVQLIGYFLTTDALSGASGVIPTSRVIGAIGANTPAPFTGTFSGYSNAVQFFTQTLASAPNSARTDAMSIGLDYTTGATPTAGSYTGTLNLVLLVQ